MEGTPEQLAKSDSEHAFGALVQSSDSEAIGDPNQRLSAASNVVRTNLGLLNSIVAEHKLDAEGFLSGPLAALQRRLASNEIKLAVLGEFSSGKTTFVNALLNTNILEVGILPTTAVCTSIRFGVTSQCHVVLKSGQLVRIGPDELGRFSPSGPRGKEVEEITLELPSSLLADGLILVDTPGVNVNIDRHEAITCKAIGGANACVYLMDARQPGKKTTIDFLRQIRQNVGKFFFVLNRADILDPAEQEEVLDYVRNALIHECGISNPRVELLSSLTSSNGVWADRFEAFKQRLNEFMVRERDSVISAELARLLDDAIVRTDYLLGSKFRLAEQELSEHYKTSLPDAAQIVNSLRGQLDCIISSDADKAQSCFCDFHEAICNQLREIVERYISSPSSVETLVNVVPKQLSQAFETHAVHLDEFVGRLLRTIFTTRQAQVATAVKQMFSHVRWLDQRAFFTRFGIWVSVVAGALLLFGVEYGFEAPRACVIISPLLGATAGAVFYGTYYWARNRTLFSPVHVPKPGYAGYVQAIISGGTLYQQAASNPTHLNTAPIQIGRVAGNLAGNPWFGVVGGAISGAMYGAQLLWDKFSGKLGKLRKEIRKNVMPLLDEFERETKTGGNDAVASGKESTMSALNQVLDNSMQRYQIILDRLVRPHKRIRLILEQRRDRLHDDAMRLRTSRQLVIESLRTLEMELKGVFSYHPEPNWAELDRPARHSESSHGDSFGIPLLKPDDIDFHAENSGDCYAASVGNPISRASGQPLVLGWIGCLLVFAVLSFTSFKVAGAFSSRPDSGHEAALSSSSPSNGSTQPPSREPTTNLGAKPGALGSVLTTDSAASQTAAVQSNPATAIEVPDSTEAASAQTTPSPGADAGTTEPASVSGTAGDNPQSQTENGNVPIGGAQEATALSGDNTQSQTAIGNSSTTNTQGLAATAEGGQGGNDYNRPNTPGRQDARKLNARALQLLSESPPDLLGASYALEAAVRLDPANVEIQDNLGYVFGRIGNYRSAESILTWVVRVAPTRRVAQGNLGYVEAKLGKVTDASDHFCQYIRLFTSVEQGKSTLVRVMNDPDPNVQTAVRLTMDNCTE